jgi:hypothetical protein
LAPKQLTAPDSYAGAELKRAARNAFFAGLKTRASFSFFSFLADKSHSFFVPAVLFAWVLRPKPYIAARYLVR